MARTVVGMFESFDAARAALDELVASGIPEKDLGLIRPDERGGRELGSKERGAKVGMGAAAGAGTGAAAGGAAGLIAALAGVAIPGFGPMVAAGWLASTLAGAGFGAVAGGLIGALIGSGVPEHEARVFEEGLRRGHTLVVARCEEARASRVAEVLARHGAQDVERSAKDFESRGWTRAPEPAVPGERTRIFEDYVAREGTREPARPRGVDRPLAAGRAAGDQDTESGRLHRPQLERPGGDGQIERDPRRER